MPTQEPTPLRWSDPLCALAQIDPHHRCARRDHRLLTSESDGVCYLAAHHHARKAAIEQAAEYTAHLGTQRAAQEAAIALFHAAEELLAAFDDLDACAAFGGTVDRLADTARMFSIVGSLARWHTHDIAEAS